MVNVRRSTVIDAPVSQVWAIMRDFNGHDRWHPAVADSKLENGRQTDGVGAVRSFHLASGEHLREQLLSLSDHDLTMSYCIIESPIPLDGYVAHVRLIPVTDGNATYCEWTSSFRTPPGQEQALAELVGDGVYTAGFDAIRELLGAPANPRPPGDDPIGQSGSTMTDPSLAVAQHSGIAVSSTATNNFLPSRASVLQGFGDPAVLQTTTLSVGPPATGEVRIRHTAIGVNYIDVYCRTGLFNLVSPDGGVPGLEAAGTIVDVGPDTDGWHVGDRIAYATEPAGAYCEVRNMPVNRLVRLPDDISDENAAASLVKGLTAHFLLHQVHRVVPGETVLVHAAAGGVGLLLSQWAKELGARVIGTVSSFGKSQIALENGCDHVINYTETDFAPAVADLTSGHGVAVVIDGVGAETFTRSIQALGNCGHLISYGQASGPIGPQDIDSLAAKSITLSRPNFSHYTDTETKLASGSDQLFDAMRRGALRVRIDRQFSLSEAADAHRWLESRQSTGSNLLIA